MRKLSAVIITKNESQHIAQCLDTLGWVDEIIILDSGSTDETVDIAKSYGARVEQQPDWKGFGLQRQRAQELATSEWILMIDADERVTPELATSIKSLIQGKHVIGSISRLSWCFGSYIRHSGWYPDRVERLFPRLEAGYNDALVHEKIQNPNNLPIRKLEGDLLHFTYDNMRHYLTKSAHYAELWANQKQERQKKTSLSSAILHGIGCFLRMYILKAGFLDGKQGLLLALLSAHSTFVKYADLWLRSQPARANIDQVKKTKFDE